MRIASILAGVAWRLVLLLGLFNLLLLLVRPEVRLNFDAGTENRIMAERYLYGATPAAVLVGSSLGHAIARFLPEDFYGLALSGGSPSTGAEIILRGAPNPRVVVVETNVMERQPDQAMVNRVFAEPGFTLRRVIPGFRTEFRPVLIAANLERLHPDFRLSRLTSSFRAAGAPPARIRPGQRPPVEQEADDPRLADGVKLQLDYDAHFDAGQRRHVSQGIAELKNRIALLQRRGICVLLARLPVQRPVDLSPFEHFQAEQVRQAFPESHYNWLNIANDGTYHTADGLHLTAPSGARVASIISERVSQMLAGKAPCRR
jgi:hypothetical protein